MSQPCRQGSAEAFLPLVKKSRVELKWSLYKQLFIASELCRFTHEDVLIELAIQVTEPFHLYRDIQLAMGKRGLHAAGNVVHQFRF